jgi:hypothetical protein
VSTLPAYDRLYGAKRVLLLGAGGGYDVFGAVPLFAELRERGIHADFASVSFTALEALSGAVRHPAVDCLYRVDAACAVGTCYCPEAWLARWLGEAQSCPQPVWGLAKTGVRPLRRALSTLVADLGCDLVVLVDGGIDLILRGDETSLGTPSEDLATLGAAARLDVPFMATCIGFGTELREGIPHAQVLERIAELQRAGAFLGATSLVSTSLAGRAYRDALAFVRAGQADQRGTRIHDVIVRAMDGEFGGQVADEWVSPLASLRWFFDGPGLAASHLFLPHLETAETIWDVTNIIRACRKSMAVRPRTDIPI